MTAELERIAPNVHKRLTEHHLKGRTITLKVKYSDFTIITRSKSFAEPVDDVAPIASTAKELLLATEPEGSSIHFLGITVSNFGQKIVAKQESISQLPLFK